MDVGGHEHLFLSALELKTWFELVVSEVEDVVQHEAAVEMEKAGSQTITFLEGEANSLHYLRAFKIYWCDL